MFRFQIKHLASFAAITLVALGVGCGSPAVVEGDVLGETFEVRDDNPELRVAAHSGEATIVFAEDNGETMRTVVMVIPAETHVEPGVPVPLVGEGAAKGSGIYLELSQGDLVEIIEGGRRIVHATDPEYFDVVGGTVIFDSVSDPISGTFVAEIAGGGTVRGSFVIDGTLR